VNKKKNGLTLIEILVVIAIIGILVTIVIFGSSRYRAKSQDETRKADLKQIGAAMVMFRAKEDSYPVPNPEDSGCLSAGSVVSQLYSKISFDVPQDKYGSTGCYNYELLGTNKEAFKLWFTLKTDATKKYQIYGIADCAKWDDIGGKPDGEEISSGPEDCQIAKEEPTPPEEEPAPPEVNIYAQVLANMIAISAAAEQYKNATGEYALDGANGVAPAFVPTYLSKWPDPPCPGIAYDWDSWPNHYITYPDGTSWTPIRRIGIRRLSDNTNIYYHGIQANPKGKYDCNDLYWNDGWGDGYCKSSTSWDPVIENIPSKSLKCEDLLDTSKFPSVPRQS